MVVGNRLDVGLDDGSADFVISWPWPRLFLHLEESLAHAAALERRTAVQLARAFDREVLSGSDRAD